MTRPEDAAAAVQAGADYVGLIFAGGPRHLTLAQAREIVTAVGGRARVIGVFGTQPPEEIAVTARDLSLDGVQLHADPTAADVERLRATYDGRIWAAARLAHATLTPDALALFTVADGVVLDARAEGSLGGTGKTLDWSALALRLARVRGATALLVLAGGLTAANVAEAVQLLMPDVVDVSSGIEDAPGIKNHDRMRAFVENARLAAIAPRG